MKKLIPVIIFGLLILGCSKENLEEELQSSSPTNDYAVVDKLIENARAEFDSDPDKALSIAQSALIQSENVFYLKGQQKAHNVLHWLYLNKFENYSEAGKHNEAYKRVTEELEESQDLALLNYKKGYTLYKSNKLAEAVPYLFEARDLYQNQGDFGKEGYSLYTLSKIFEKVGQNEKGLFYLDKIDLNAIEDSFLWSIHKQRGNLNFKNGNLNEAEVSFKRAHEIVTKLDQPDKALSLLLDLSQVAIDKKNLEDADLYLNRGIDQSKEAGNQEVLAKFYIKKGLRHLASKDHEIANQWGQKALGIGKEINSPELVATAYLNLSNGCFWLGKLKEARSFAQVGLEAKSEAMDQTASDLHFNISLFSKEMGDLLTHHKHESLLKDIRIHQLENSEFAAVHKAELDYKEKIKLVEHEAYVEAIHKEIAEDDRRATFYLMGFGMLIILAIILLAMRKPVRFFLRSADRVVYLMEELQGAFKRRLAAEGPMFPITTQIKKPEPPDERDIYNLWRGSRKHRKGGKDKDKGGDDDTPVPGLD